MEIKKIFYTMGEVAEMFDVSSSLIRYWEKQFDVIKPSRNKKGNRLFTPQDVENFRLIYHLVKERGMTLEGARKSLRGAKVPMSRDAELMDRLQNMRALLLEVREALKEGGEESEEEAVREMDEREMDERGESEELSGDESTIESSAKSRSTGSRKRGDSSEEKELFAFYEQKLF